MSKDLINLSLAGKDLLPVPKEKQNWGTYTMFSLYWGCAIALSNVLLGGALIGLGLHPIQALTVSILGTIIVLGIIVLNGVPGSKYGITHPVQLRASFGIQGAKLPSLMRGIVACFWWGINTWIGGLSVDYTFGIIFNSWNNLFGHLIISVFLFWVLQVLITWRGFEGIKLLATLSAPVMLILMIFFIGWGRSMAGTWGPLFETKPASSNIVIMGMLAVAATWITLSLNISDFSRMTKTKSNIYGLFTGLVPGMFAVVLVGVLSASMATALNWGLLFNPVDFMFKFNLNPFLALLVLIFILTSTFTTNIPANQVAPANTIINFWPDKITFPVASFIVAIVGMLTMPWKILESPGAFFRFLTVYGGCLGPIVGIMICDYWVIRKGELKVNDLFKFQGAYTYYKGWNPAAILALVIGIILALLFVNYAWLIGLPVGFLVYWVLMKYWISKKYQTPTTKTVTD
jgi:NCS1 family nucleobase:cation symporter-1